MGMRPVCSPVQLVPIDFSSEGDSPLQQGIQ
jgi:hypothetical protein